MVRRRELLKHTLVLAAGALAGGLGASVTAGCQRHTTPRVDRHAMLVDLAAKVIVPGFEEASRAADDLRGELEALRDAPTDAALEAARAAWRSAHAAYKRTEALALGPGDDLAITGGVIDGGPPDEAKLAALVAGDATLDAARVTTLGGNQRGFAGLEWLLFAGDLASLDARRLALGPLLARDLASKLEAVRDAWRPSGGDFARELSEAGRGSATFAAERQGVDAAVNALIAAAEILVAVRLAKPLGLDASPVAPHPELVESRLARASVEDLLAVLDGIERAYTCSDDDACVSLSDTVRDVTPGADDRLRADLAAARQAVRAIPPPLAVAVETSRELVLAAHAAVRELKRRLATDVAGALGTSVGFNVTDGD